MNALARNSWILVSVLALLIGAIVFVTFHATRVPSSHHVPGSPEIVEAYELSTAE